MPVCLPLTLFGLLTGCVHMNSSVPELSSATPQRSGPVQDSPPAPPPATFVPTPTAPATPDQPTPTNEPAKPQAATNSKPPSKLALKRPPTAAPAVPATAAQPAPLPASAATPKPQLDFKAMEQRLRDTSAIGVFTKLSIKNQVDDLLKAFRGYHGGHIPPTLDELHQRYDGLLLKVVTLVQNDDATLASSISASRGAIWERLSNKESFQAI